VNRKQIIAEALSLGGQDDGWELSAFILAVILTSSQREVLKQILHTPTWDGDIVSKCARDDLIDMGLATRCCYRGEQGYTAATYLAYTVAHALDDPAVKGAVINLTLAGLSRASSDS